MSDLKIIPINPKALDLPSGTASFEERRAILRKELSDKIPRSRWLDEKVVSNAPKDVTAIIGESGLLTEEEIAITEKYDAPTLVKQMIEGKLTSVDVTTAFCKRAVIAHQLTGCLVDYFEEEALEAALKADQHLKQTGKPLGPLHGLPISVKDHMPLKGHPASTGFLSTREEKSKEDCLLISILRKAGAIFYVKTNQPQAIMHLECTSFMFRTLNPFNTTLSAGGSTGGEAALIALRGSILGLGTDIGGSIRGPSAFCGIWGFKPSSQIVPLTGMPVGVLSAPISIACCGGPMTVSLEGINYFMKVILDAKPELQDSQLLRWNWPTSFVNASPKKLRVGFVLNDGHITPQPPVTNALLWARELLDKAKDKIELVPYTPYNVAEGNKLLHSLYYPTGYTELRKALKDGGEPEYSLTTNTLRETREKPLDAFEIARKNADLQDFRVKFVEHFNKFDLDVILAPCFVGPACSHDTAFYWNYTSIWNIMDWPGCVFPTPIRATGKEKYTNEEQAKEMSLESSRVVELWNKGDFEGAPVNLQLIARRHYDNELIEALHVIQGILSS
ncbi:amidase [Meira miltonrushii]|uniref:Amidase n=1 Tax=Meira miltonrushii TaxID=1280837 RepID=A0A316V605_9BASI|nr:amidase [Meira miltonrushii]PWN32990.1 amidase [Meira miltonrushii]